MTARFTDSNHGTGKRLLAGVFALFLAWCCQSAVLFETEFDGAEIGQVPEAFIVLDGQFAVRNEGDATFLELPGAPLESFGVLFGPSRTNDVSVAARIFATSKGRRFPAFAVSLSGVSGYRLQVAPAKGAVELLRGDVVIASEPFAEPGQPGFRWESGRWTHLLLELKGGPSGPWNLEGKTWMEGSTEPDAPSIQYREETAPVAGKAGVWGKPFSGTPIRFDDLKVTARGNP
jgi:hypothetical protein